MKTTACLFVAACTAGPVCAQSVSLSVAAATPLSVQASIASASQSQVLPPGPLPGSGQAAAILSPVGSYAEASIIWDTFAPLDNEIRFIYAIRGVVASQGPASAVVDGNELLLSLTASSPREVKLQGTVDTYLSPGGVGPTLEVDIGDDGSVEYSSAAPSFLTPTITVGPQPVPIRIRGQGVAVTAGGPASFSSALTLYVRPENRVLLTRNVLGCGGGSGGLLVLPSFTSGGISIAPDGLGPILVVASTSQQPVVLPSFVPNCLLLPAPEVVVLVGAAGLPVPIPPGVRPIVFYVQGVTVFSPSNFTTTDGYEIDAW